MHGTAWIAWAIIFSAFGAAYFVYGKRRKALVPLVSGLVLCIFPFFVSNVYLLVLLGLVILLLPYFIRQ